MLRGLPQAPKPLELGLGACNLRFVACPLELGLGTFNSRFVAWPLELGLGTLNPRLVAWPLELGLETHNPCFVACPLELGLGPSDFGLRVARIAHRWPTAVACCKPWLMCPKRDQVLPKHTNRPIAYGNTVAIENILAVLPSKLPFCAYSISVNEVAVEGDIVPSVGATPLLYGCCLKHVGVPQIQSEGDLLALWQQLQDGTIHHQCVPCGSLSPCIVRYIAAYHF